MRRALARIYGVLIYGYPPSLRRAHGAEMRQCARTALARGGAPSAPRLFLDLAVSAAREWTHVLKGLPVKRLLISGLGRDVAFAVRLLWRSPGYTIAAVITLALGIGANTAVFSLADATLIRPLRIERPASLVAFKWSASLPDYREWAARTDLFDGVAAVSGARATAVLDGAPDVIDVSFVSPNYFTVLGVGTSRGRLLGEADAGGGDIVGVLDHGWWRARFAGDPSVIGRTIRLNGELVTVAGVAAEGFRGTSLMQTPKMYLPVGSPGTELEFAL